MEKRREETLTSSRGERSSQASVILVSHLWSESPLFRTSLCFRLRTRLCDTQFASPLLTAGWPPR